MICYEKYKPSGLDWIGNIPSDWNLKKLKHLSYLKARVGWHGLKADEFSLDKQLPYCITGTDFNDGIINWESCYRISEDRYNEDLYIQLKENDLLVTKDGTIGKVAVVKKLNGKAILNSGVFVMRPVNKQYNSSFMYWLIQSETFNEFIKYTSKGSTIIHLYQDTFLNWPIPLPSLAEQTIIANYLDDKTRQINKLIANKQKLIELLKEERTVIINEAVSGEGKNWERKKLKYVTEKIGDGIHATPEYTDYTDFFFVNGTNLNDGRIEFKELTRTVSEDEYLSLKLELKTGTVLLSLNGTIGKIAFYQGEKIILGKSVAYIECLKDLYNLYAYYVLQSDYVEEYFHF